MFRRVIYISRSLIGADPDGIAAIVSSSVQWNSQADVTGMLWADGQSFAQVIEGSHDAVGQTMDRIRVDQRHTDIDVLLDRPVLSKTVWNLVDAKGG
ncbi:BLUF domain-containing protein [Sphingomonas faeni]|uniref:BLUF domain-containing protein n=1 Tax=Sphingomonas faeni TaxID=185950 RepID=UPI002412EFF1|nr:BLUF domain-containing protein [Sphingomonas faeni]